MIVLVQLPSKCARILYHFSLTKTFCQRRRVVYQNPFAYDLALLFITYVNMNFLSWAVLGSQGCREKKIKLP